MKQPLKLVRGAAGTLTVKLKGRRRPQPRPTVAYRPQPLQRWDP